MEGVAPPEVEAALRICQGQARRRPPINCQKYRGDGAESAPVRRRGRAYPFPLPGGGSSRGLRPPSDPGIALHQVDAPNGEHQDEQHGDELDDLGNDGTVDHASSPFRHYGSRGAGQRRLESAVFRPAPRLDGVPGRTGAPAQPRAPDRPDPAHPPAPAPGGAPDWLDPGPGWPVNKAIRSFVQRAVQLSYVLYRLKRLAASLELSARMAANRHVLDGSW